MTPSVVAETDLAGTIKSEYIFFAGDRVARRDGPTGARGVFYYFSDHLKTALEKAFRKDAAKRLARKAVAATGASVAFGTGVIMGFFMVFPQTLPGGTVGQSK
jgi:hypothetical protein